MTNSFTLRTVCYPLTYALHAFRNDLNDISTFKWLSGAMPQRTDLVQVHEIHVHFGAAKNPPSKPTGLDFP